MRRILPILIVLMLLPALLNAQSRGKKGRDGRTVTIVTQKHRSDCCWGNRFSLEPYGGAVKDAYDISPDGSNTAYLVGLKLGYRTGGRSRLIGNFGYSSSDNVSNPSGLGSYYVYDNTWLFTTAGAEYDVIPGRTSAALGVQAGAAWRRVDLDGQVGVPVGPSEEDRGFSAQELIVPSITLRHRLTSRATIVAGLHDYISDVFEGPAQHGVAATLGVSFR